LFLKSISLCRDFKKVTIKLKSQKEGRVIFASLRQSAEERLQLASNNSNSAGVFERLIYSNAFAVATQISQP